MTELQVGQESAVSLEVFGVAKTQPYLYANTTEVVDIGSGDDMRFSGYISTKNVDLGGHSILPTAFEDYLERYMANPVYLYQHDQLQPIGVVRSLSVDANGLYFEDVELVEIPVVKNVIWPLVKAGALRQQSVGLYPLRAVKLDSGVLQITKAYMIEGSLVTIAQNPEAHIDMLKSAGVFSASSLQKAVDNNVRLYTIAELVDAYQNGALEKTSMVQCMLSLDSAREDAMSKDITKATPPTPIVTPDFADLDVRPHNDQAFDKDGVAIAMPAKFHARHDEIKDMCHAAYSPSRKAWMFKLGAPTATGFTYNWDDVAVSMCQALGAKGGFLASDEQRSAVIARISKAYEVLGKEAPTVELDGDTYAISDITVEALGQVRFDDVTFKNDERAVLMASIIQSNGTALLNGLTAVAEPSDALLTQSYDFLKKYVSAYVTINGYLDSSEEFAMFQDFLNSVERLRNKKDEEETTDSVIYSTEVPVVETPAPVVKSASDLDYIADILGV